MDRKCRLSRMCGVSYYAHVVPLLQLWYMADVYGFYAEGPALLRLYSQATLREEVSKDLSHRQECWKSLAQDGQA
jgi:hypothetical protein